MHLLLEWFKSCCKDHFFPRTFTVILIHCRLYDKQKRKKKKENPVIYQENKLLIPYARWLWNFTEDWKNSPFQNEEGE